jgi:hypothetical protein
VARKLGREPRLAETGVADDGDELATLLLERAPPGLPQRVELRRPADEAALVPALRLMHGRESIGGNGLCLALERQRLHRLDNHRFADDLEGRLADQDLTRLGRLLQACGDVDGVAGGEALLRSGDHLARVDADPGFDAELGQRRSHLERRSADPERVVLVHLRDAEDGHHRVADELLHRAAVALDDLLHALEVAGKERAQRLGID